MIDINYRSATRDPASGRPLADGIARAQAQVAANRRILKPSDDAAASARLSVLRQQGSGAAAARRNLDLASALSSQADSVLAAGSALIGRALELTQAAANGTLTLDDRRATAIALRSIADDFASLRGVRGANGQPVFASGPSLAIPVGDGTTIVPVPTGDTVFALVDGAASRSIADIVRDAATALERGDGGAHVAIGSALDDLNRADTQLAATRAIVGLTGQRVDQLGQQNDDAAIRRGEDSATIDGFDLAATMAQINRQQLTLQAAQAVYARIGQTSLFDLLR